MNCNLLFFIKNLQQLSDSFKTLDYVSFSHTTTRASANFKLIHIRSTTNTNHYFYFNRLPRLWNSLLPINPYSSFCSIKLAIIDIFWTNFHPNLTYSTPVHIALDVSALNASNKLVILLSRRSTDNSFLSFSCHLMY